ncbi:MAG: hypothetical protein KGP14_07855 [Betaproteobacteria bacterium]|nr:hypothetical protein [Betaproteobacteria bacterium]
MAGDTFVYLESHIFIGYLPCMATNLRPTSPQVEIIGVQLPPDQIMQLDAWIAKEMPGIARAEAIKLFVAAALEPDAGPTGGS